MSNLFLNLRGHLMDLTIPRIMGIINVTPDSFFAGSRNNSVEEALRTAEHMMAQGVDFLDVGGYSSRPGAEDISTYEEQQRVLPIIAHLMKTFPEAKISIDSFRSEVAKEAIDLGACMINDISGGHMDEKMVGLAAEKKVPYIGMHMRGTPQTMNALTDYEDILLETGSYFGQMKSKADEAGLTDLIIDPGFGFAKTIEQNYYLLKHLSYLKHLECPILVGLSRKSMIYKALKVDPEEALNGTSALNTIALLNGANLLRVHDVKEAKEIITLLSTLNVPGV